MRCLACDKCLTDYEATRAFQESGEFVDLCNKCFSTIADSVSVSERPDLKEYEDVTDTNETEQ